MKKNNNIDRLFSEALSNYSETPPAFIWDAIADAMQGAKQSKKILLLWRGVAAAAIIGLIFLGGLFWNNSNNNFADANLQPQDTAVQQLGQDNMESSENKRNIDETTTANKKAQATFNQSKNTSISENKNLPVAKDHSTETGVHLLASALSIKRENNTANNKGANKGANKNTSTDNSLHEHKQGIKNVNEQGIEQKNTPDYTDAKDNEESLILALRKMEAQTVHQLADFKTPDALQLHTSTSKLALKSSETDNWIRAFDNSKPAKPSDKKSLQFALGGHFSPSYSYNDAESSNTSTMASANEDGIISYTGGINLNIKTRKRWEIETGVYYSQIGQKFSNPIIGNPSKMIYTASPGTGIQSKKPNLNNSMGNLIVNPSAQQELIKEVAINQAAIRLNSNDYAHIPTQVEAVTVQQELDYIEIPFLVRYNLLKKLVGLSFSGGMSTNFLIGNNAYRIENSSKNLIGETQGINEISYSAIFGIGIRTPILKSLDFNLEPRIKYFMNSVTHSSQSSYKPYSIGIYTGVSYHF